MHKDIKLWKGAFLFSAVTGLYAASGFRFDQIGNDWPEYGILYVDAIITI